VHHQTLAELSSGFTADPATSRSLSGRFYWDADVAEAERKAIFRRTWQYVCPVGRLREPRSYAVADVGGDSLVVLRHPDGDLRAFFNVCQHRGHHLLEGAGQLGAVITCPYHLWAYGLDGALRSARGIEDQEAEGAFDRDAVCLTSVRVETLAGLVFVNLDAAAPSMAETYPGLEADILSYVPNAADLVPTMRHDYGLAANWKVSVENYAECYHCPNRHPGLSTGALDMASYRIECHATHHVHRSRDVGAEQAYALDPDAARGGDFASFYIWPNLAVEVYPGGYLTTFAHRPSGPETCVQETEWLVPNPEPTEEQRAAAAFVHEVREEDIPICESVQRGMRSPGYHGGYFVVDAGRTSLSEHAVHDFQKKVLAALEADAGEAAP
jgi:phenylpropionate dioxygenase-like ring-hydroxylating dioxygenase large terminal subunit